MVRRAETTLDAVTPALGRTRTAVRRLAPLLPAATSALGAADPAIRQSDRALGALRDGGFFEGLWSFLYYGASAISRFDGNGHLLAGLILLNRCTVVTPVPVEGCEGYLRNEQSGAATGTVPAAARSATRSLLGPPARSASASSPKTSGAER